MAKEDEKKEDEKLTPVGEGAESSEKETKKPAETKAADEKVGHGEEEDDDGEEIGGDESDPERARIRERRRREKQNRARRIANDRRELDFLRKRNEDVERQLSQVVLRQNHQEVASVDQRIGYLEGQIREAENIHTQAVEAKDGATATEALRVKDALRESLSTLKSTKEERQKETAKKPVQEKAAGPDPEAVRNGRNWLKENDWFDPELGDEDSYLARAIEERMAREGRLDPRDEEYWEEFNRRIDKRLPGLRKKKAADDSEDDNENIFEEDDEKPRKKPAAKKPAGPRIAVGGKTRSLKPNEVYISEQRKQALMDAGVWDDPERRERYLKSYKKWDEDAAQRNS